MNVVNLFIFKLFEKFCLSSKDSESKKEVHYVMRKIKELIYKEENAWLMILEWVKKAENQVEVLKNNRADGEKTLLQHQVTNKSTNI